MAVDDNPTRPGLRLKLRPENDAKQRKLLREWKQKKTLYRAKNPRGRYTNVVKAELGVLEDQMEWEPEGTEPPANNGNPFQQQQQQQEQQQAPFQQQQAPLQQQQTPLQQQTTPYQQQQQQQQSQSPPSNDKDGTQAAGGFASLFVKETDPDDVLVQEIASLAITPDGKPIGYFRRGYSYYNVYQQGPDNGYKKFISVNSSSPHFDQRLTEGRPKGIRVKMASLQAVILAPGDDIDSLLPVGWQLEERRDGTRKINYPWCQTKVRWQYPDGSTWGTSWEPRSTVRAKWGNNKPIRAPADLVYRGTVYLSAGTTIGKADHDIIKTFIANEDNHAASSADNTRPRSPTVLRYQSPSAADIARGNSVPVLGDGPVPGQTTSASRMSAPPASHHMTHNGAPGAWPTMAPQDYAQGMPAQNMPGMGQMQGMPAQNVPGMNQMLGVPGANQMQGGGTMGNSQQPSYTWPNVLPHNNGNVAVPGGSVIGVMGAQSTVGGGNPFVKTE